MSPLWANKFNKITEKKPNDYVALAVVIASIEIILGYIWPHNSILCHWLYFPLENKNSIQECVQ